MGFPCNNYRGVSPKNTLVIPGVTPRDFPKNNPAPLTLQEVKASLLGKVTFHCGREAGGRAVTRLPTSVGVNKTSFNETFYTGYELYRYLKLEVISPYTNEPLETLGMVFC